MDDLKESLDRRIPKIVTTSHIMYNNGSITPIEKIGNIIKDTSKEILFSIDGAQSVGSIEVDVKKIKCDFLSFPAFKWICGPLGIGILYVDEKVMDTKFKPIFIGSGTAKIKEEKKSNNKDEFPISKKSHNEIGKLEHYGYPEKYHPTFRNYPGLAGLEASLRYILRLGISNIHKKNIKLSKLFREEILKIDDIVIHEAKEEEFRSSMICFSFRKHNNNKVGYLVDELQKRGIILAEREIGQKKIARASPHFYNSEEEMIKTVSEIKSILNQFN
jgi:cysteine desulfurase/selenocysteine lyase